MFLGHQRDVLEPWRHVKWISLKLTFDFKSPYRHGFWLGLLWSYRNASKMSILRVYNSIFLEPSRRCMPPLFQAERVHNHPKSLYRADFWVSPLLTLKLYSNIHHAPNLQKTVVKLMQNPLENGSKTILRWFFSISSNSFLNIIGRF